MASQEWSRHRSPGSATSTNRAAVPILAGFLLAFLIAVSSVPLPPPRTELAVSSHPSGNAVPAAVGGRFLFESAPSASPAAQADSWAVGIHAVNGTPNPGTVQGIEMTAFLPTVPSGLTSMAGPYYMLVMSVIFPNGRFLQLDVRASPAGTDGCLVVACYQSVYNIAKFPGGLSAFTIEPEAPGATYTLAVWRDAAAGRWRYGIGRGTPPNLTVERSDFLSNLDASFADADAYASINVNQVDEWYGTSAFLQEFAALESYDWSAADWSLIGTLDFGPALGFFVGSGTAVWPSMNPSRAALACTTGLTCRDPDGRPYLGFIGCCNPVPSFAYIAGLFQGRTVSNAFQSGQGTSPGAPAGAILWADLPSIANVSFVPEAIRTGNLTTLSYRVLNPNGFSLLIGFRRAIRSNPDGTALPDPSSDLAPITVPGGITTETQGLPTSTGIGQSFYDVQVDVWSGVPGTAPATVLTTSGWKPKALVVDDAPPTTSALLVGTRGNGGWYLSAVTVDLTGVDVLSGVASTWYRLDGTNVTPFAVYSAPVAIVTGGAHSLAYYSVDRAGNAGTREAILFEIDAAPPSLSILTPMNGAHLPNGTFTVTWTAADGGSGIDYYTVQLSGDPPVNVSRALSYRFQALPNGTYVIRVTAADGAGNEAVQTITVQVGTVPLNTTFIAASILAAIVVIAVLAAVALKRRRTRPPTETEGEGPKEEDEPRKE